MNAELKSFIDSLNLEYKATFVPQSASRNSAEENPSLNWRVSIARRNVAGDPAIARNTIATDYMQGIGHLPTDANTREKHKGANRNCIMIADYERKCAESGRYGLWNGTPIPAPSLADVLYSLVMDSDAGEYTFEEWAGNFGYDTDSRTAESMYNQCRDTGSKLRRMLGAENLSKLRDLFQDY